MKNAITNLLLIFTLLVFTIGIAESQTSICGLPSAGAVSTDYVPVNSVSCGPGTTHKVTISQLVTSGGAGVYAPVANPIPSATTCTNQAVTSIGTTGAGVCSSITESFLSLSNNTTGNASIARHGFLPILDNTASHFLDGTGAWGNVVIPSTTCTNQAITALTTGAAGSCNSITEDFLSLSAVTTGNASTSKHGFLPMLDNDTTHFLNGQGGWTTPFPYPGAGIAVSTGSAWDTSITKGTLTDGKWCSYATATGLSCTQNTPGGTPGGSDTHVQYNDGGSAFGGDANLTWNKTTQQLSIIGKNAGSSSTPLLVNPGASFTGNLFDFKLGTNSVLAMTQSGSITLNGSLTSTIGNLTFGGASTLGSISAYSSTDGLIFGIDGRGSASSMFKFTTPVEAMNQTSGTRSFFSIQPTYNQASGTAVNTDFLIKRTETAVGSGLQKIIELQIGTNPIFNITNKGHVNTDDAAGSTTYPALTDCGTTPALVAGSTDFAGKITFGATAGTPSVCTITFGTAYVATPSCVFTVTGATDAYIRITAESASALTVSANASVDLSSKTINYHCIGINGG